MIKEKNVFFLGIGSIGLKHIKLIQNNFKNINLFVLRKSKKKIFNHNRITYLNNISELNNIDIFAAIICTPSNTHVHYAKKISKFTNKIFIEKPLSTKLSTAFNFLNYINMKKINIYIGYNLLFDELIINLKKIIMKRNLHDILSVNIESQSYLPLWRTSKNYTKDVSAQKKLGGGVLLELSHEINYLLEVFGKIKYVYAVLKSSKTLNIDVDDFAEIIMENSKKCIFRIHLNFNSRKNIRKCEIITNKETIVADLLNRDISIYYKKGKKVRKNYQSSISDSYKKQFDKFFKNSSRFDKNNNILMSIETQKIINAIRQSFKAKTRILIK